MIIFGMAPATGTYFRNLRGRFTRIPIRKRTKSPSISAHMRLSMMPVLKASFPCSKPYIVNC